LPGAQADSVLQQRVRTGRVLQQRVFTGLQQRVFTGLQQRVRTVRVLQQRRAASASPADTNKMAAEARSKANDLMVVLHSKIAARFEPNSRKALSTFEGTQFSEHLAAILMMSDWVIKCAEAVRGKSSENTD